MTLSMVKKFFLLGVSVVAFSCTKDKCEDITCQNSGNCVDGTCQCAAGYSGANCQTADIKFFICNNSSKVWKLSAMESNGKPVTLDEEFLSVRLTFKSDGTFIRSWVGKTETENSTWSYDSAKNILVVEELTTTSASISSNQMVIKWKDDAGESLGYTLVPA